VEERLSARAWKNHDLVFTNQFEGYLNQSTLRHVVLRWILSRRRVFPWQAQAFLEDATSRILVRRAGGGYSFMHRLLLEYFARMDDGRAQRRGRHGDTWNVAGRLSNHLYTLWHRVMVQILPSDPWDYHKKPTKTRQKADFVVLKMVVFQYAPSYTAFNEKSHPCYHCVRKEGKRAKERKLFMRNCKASTEEYDL
jgi:hypothetical protein